MKTPTQSHEHRGAPRRVKAMACFLNFRAGNERLAPRIKRPRLETGDIMTFREPNRESHTATTEVAQTALMREDEVEEPTAALIEEEPEEAPSRVPEESLTTYSSKG